MFQLVAGFMVSALLSMSGVMAGAAVAQDDLEDDVQVISNNFSLFAEPRWDEPLVVAGGRIENTSSQFVFVTTAIYVENVATGETDTCSGMAPRFVTWKLSVLLPPGGTGWVLCDSMFVEPGSDQIAVDIAITSIEPRYSDYLTAGRELAGLELTDFAVGESDGFTQSYWTPYEVSGDVRFPADEEIVVLMVLYNEDGEQVGNCSTAVEIEDGEGAVECGAYPLVYPGIGEPVTVEAFAFELIDRD